jgi:ABC-2 type transport system ATP-binding protein
MNVIETRQLAKRFDFHDILSSVDLTIERGSSVGLIGANGSGKSTLIKCLLGLLKVSSGTSNIFGDDSWNLSARSKAKIGYVAQKPNFYPWMSSLDIVDYYGAFYDSWDKGWTRELMKRWELSSHMLAGVLSPGQKQRLAMVVALGHRPELIILDEPVASLDPIGRRESLRQLIEVTQDGDHTMLYSTHILSDLERVASHVAILADGRISCYDELDLLKDRFKRLRMASTHILPNTFAIPGALQVNRFGREAIVTLPNVTEDKIDELRRKWDCEITIEDLNLEEIFLEFSGRESS